VINAGMFVVELAFGLRAGSDVATGLIADGLSRASGGIDRAKGDQ